MRNLRDILQEGFYQNVNSTDEIKAIKVCHDLQDLINDWQQLSDTQKKAKLNEYDYKIHDIIRSMPVWFGFSISQDKLSYKKAFVKFANFDESIIRKTFYFIGKSITCTYKPSEVWTELKDDLLINNINCSVKACTWHEVGGKKIVDLLESVNSVNEGFYNNVGHNSDVLIELIKDHCKKEHYTKDSIVLWSVLWLLYKEEYLSKDEILMNFPSKTGRINRSGEVCPTACCNTYFSKISAKSNIDKYALRPVVNTMNGRRNYTDRFRKFLDDLHIKYTEGSDATGRQTSDIHNYIIIDK